MAYNQDNDGIREPLAIFRRPRKKSFAVPEAAARGRFSPALPFR
ncbi:hypothetical protein [Paenibacillus sp. UNC496MF]|nr:hypothetical protein [Paenibacillus sp. UNC496MF]